jgi:hypothetical protein
MHRLSTTYRSFWPRLLALLAAIGQLCGAVGFIPVPAKTVGVRSSVPYPCQDRPCGCWTADECWAGPCCCFTMREKVNWATEHGIVAPDRAVRLAEAEVDLDESRDEHGGENPVAASDCPLCQKQASLSKPHQKNSPRLAASKRSCCEEKSTSLATRHPHRFDSPRHSTMWVVELYAKKCRGEGPGGLLKLDPAISPGKISPRAFALTPVEDLGDFHPTISSYPHAPPTPPPRQF